MDTLLERIERLERMIGIAPSVLPTPFAPKFAPYKPFKLSTPSTFFGPENRCPTCDIDLTGPLGYVCAHPECPVGLGGAR